MSRNCPTSKTTGGNRPSSRSCRPAWPWRRSTGAWSSTILQRPCKRRFTRKQLRKTPARSFTIHSSSGLKTISSNLLRKGGRIDNCSIGFQPVTITLCRALVHGQRLRIVSKVAIEAGKYRLEAYATLKQRVVDPPGSIRHRQSVSKDELNPSFRKQLTHTLAKSGAEEFRLLAHLPRPFRDPGVEPLPDDSGNPDLFYQSIPHRSGPFRIRRTRQLFQAPEGPGLPDIAGAFSGADFFCGGAPGAPWAGHGAPPEIGRAH